MRKIFTKIICLATAAVAALGVGAASACSNTYDATPLSYKSTNDNAEQNGGFAVKKGGYVYFINGKQTNSASNTYGKVVRGAIMRISESDLSSRRYNKAETVVPLITYSGNTDGGIFIYGDYVYYSTPSTDLDANGAVQSSYLAFKRTKLDGTETMKDYYYQSSDNSIQYRYVTENGKVYLLYVVTEDLYGTSCTNLHSVDVETNEDTLLVYNAGSITFDKNDVTNPRVYYTMSVTDFELDNTFSNYNQVWTVTASAQRKYATGAVDYTDYLTAAYADEDEPYDADKDPKYVNCGSLVLDGIGIFDGIMQNITPFNSSESGLYDDNGNFLLTNDPYTYTVSSYENGTLFYTRTDTNNSNAQLFGVKQTELLGNGWLPVNNEYNKPLTDKYILEDGSSASSFTYIFDGDDLSEVLISDSSGFIKAVVGSDGKIPVDFTNTDKFYIPLGSQPTVLFTDGNYVYYSLSGITGNGNNINRIRYDGSYSNYNSFPFEADGEDYKSVRVLDLDVSSDWYNPVMMNGQILFSSQTETMSDYPYVMACDLRVRDDKGNPTEAVMDNAALKKYNEQYTGIADKISDVDETVYENLQKALNYCFFTNANSDYLNYLRVQYNEVMKYSLEYYWSDDSVAKYDAFFAPVEDGEWNDYRASVTVNDVTVTANKRDYYYSLLGKMSEEDAEAYANNLKTTYLQPEPEVEQTWFESLSTGEKVGFLIGVCAGGLIVIGAVVVVTLIIIRKKKSKLPTYKKRIKVDTTDDKDIDVYAE